MTRPKKPKKYKTSCCYKHRHRKHNPQRIKTMRGILGKKTQQAPRESSLTPFLIPDFIDF